MQRNYFTELKELGKTIPEPLAISFDNSRQKSPRNPERRKHTLKRKSQDNRDQSSQFQCLKAQENKANLRMPRWLQNYKARWPNSHNKKQSQQMSPISFFGSNQMVGTRKWLTSLNFQMFTLVSWRKNTWGGRTAWKIDLEIVVINYFFRTRRYLNVVSLCLHLIFSLENRMKYKLKNTQNLWTFVKINRD